MTQSFDVLSKATSLFTAHRFQSRHHSLCIATVQANLEATAVKTISFSGPGCPRKAVVLPGKISLGGPAYASGVEPNNVLENSLHVLKNAGPSGMILCQPGQLGQSGTDHLNWNCLGHTGTYVQPMLYDTQREEHATR